MTIKSGLLCVLAALIVGVLWTSSNRKQQELEQELDLYLNTWNKAFNLVKLESSRANSMYETVMAGRKLYKSNPDGSGYKKLTLADISGADSIAEIEKLRQEVKFAPRIRLPRLQGIIVRGLNVAQEQIRLYQEGQKFLLDATNHEYSFSSTEQDRLQDRQDKLLQEGVLSDAKVMVISKEICAYMTQPENPLKKPSKAQLPAFCRQ
jgi:hypothetical protein